MTKWAITRLILPVEYRFALLTYRKWNMAFDLVRLDLTSDLEVKVT